MDQILIGKITTSAKTKELVRWGDSPTVVRLGELCTFALTTVIGYPTKYTINGYPTKYTINGYPAKYTIDSTSGKPLFKYAHTGLELQLTATRIQDSDMIFIAIETKSKKLHYDFAKDTQYSTHIPGIGGSFANAEVTAKFGQSILLSGLPVGGLASNETSDRCLAFVITPQRGDVSHQDKPNESRSRAVSRLAKTSRSANATPLAERYEKTRRDCGLLGFHLMVIISSDTENVTEFVDQNFVDYQTNKDVSAFMQIVFSRGRKSLESVDTAFLKEQNWQLPAEGRVFACAIDAKGKELGRVEIDVSDKRAGQEAAAFIHQHAPAPVDAEKKWHEAFTVASRSRRRVWARISQRYCAPCFRMARWLDDHHKLLEKDYVMLKIDNIRDQNGIRVAKRLTRGKNHGVPFHAIFDQDELMLIDSAGPIGNIGHPSGIEGKKQLRKMLLETRRSLTDAEIDQLFHAGFVIHRPGPDRQTVPVGRLDKLPVDIAMVYIDPGRC